jgi:hypothetical protein
MSMSDTPAWEVSFYPEESWEEDKLGEIFDAIRVSVSPEDEVSTLEDLLRQAWTVMSLKMRGRFLASEMVEELLGE